MTYNTYEVINLPKEYVLNSINEYEVFSYYMGFKPEFKKLYTSPFRKDTRPSFSLFIAKNGHILYKDFGTGETGDCFKFIKTLNSLQSTSEAVKEIYKIFILNNTQPYQKKKYDIANYESSKVIGINKMPFNLEGIEYWKSYGISMEILNKYEVNQVSKVFINGILKDYYIKGNPIFSYTIYDKLKIYKPFDTVYKFYTDCNKYYIQGWKQMDYTKDYIIITKSLKDVMLLYSLGYNAIALNGEGFKIPDNILSILKSTFKKIIIFYDRDRTGIINTRKLVKDNKFDFMFIPKKYKVKDITDFYKKYNKELTINLLSKLTKNVI